MSQKYMSVNVAHFGNGKGNYFFSISFLNFILSEFFKLAFSFGYINA